MKRLNTLNGTGLITKLFPLKSGETKETGAIFELVAGGMQKVTSDATSKIIGVCHGGDTVETGKILVEVNGSTVYEDSYEGTAPTVGGLLNNCKRVLSVNTTANTYEFVIEPVVTDTTYTAGEGIAISADNVISTSGI